MAPKRKKGRPQPKPKNDRSKKRRESSVKNAIATVNEKDWRLDKSFTESMLTMFVDQISCDVHFLCGEEEEKVGAHKFVLLCRSSVFFAMFEGPAGNSDDDVKVPDIPPGTFKSFLRFLYSDKVDLSEDTLMHMMYTGKKYQVHSLISQCIQFVEKHLTVENACMLLEGCHTYSEPALQQTVLHFIEDNAVDILRSSELRDLCRECLGKILESDDLATITAADDDRNSTCSTCDGSRSVYSSESDVEVDRNSVTFSDCSTCDSSIDGANQSRGKNHPEDGAGGVGVEEEEEDVLEDFVSLERSVFEALLYWANWQCKKQKLVLSGENRREVVGDLIYKVRYNLLEPDYIVSKLTETGLLTLAERCSVMEYLVCPPLTKNIFWKAIARGPHLNNAWFPRFEEESLTTNIPCNTIEAISFLCFEDLYFHGFSLYLASEPSESTALKSRHFSVFAKLYNDSAKVLEETTVDYYDTWCSRDADSLTYVRRDIILRSINKEKDILFRRKLRLEKNKIYSLVVDMHGPSTYCGITQKNRIHGGDEGGTKYCYLGYNMRDLVQFLDYNITGYNGITGVYKGQISRVGLSRIIPESAA